MTLSITTASAGSGFYTQMIVGDPPAAAQTGPSRPQFVQAMAGLAGGSVAGSPLGPAALPATTPPLLAAARRAFDAARTVRDSPRPRGGNPAKWTHL